MSNQSSTQGHWETDSSSSRSVKIGNNPASVSGREASAEGTFDHGQRVITDSHAESFTNAGHPGRLEYTDESNNQQKTIK